MPFRGQQPHDEEGSRIGSIALPLYSPEFGHGWISPTAPDERAIARWLYGLLGTHPLYLEREPGRRVKVRRVMESLLDIDRAKRDWKSADGNWAAASRQRREAARRGSIARMRLTAFLKTGLERRMGERLVGDENTWLHLVARGLDFPGVRVCEQCTLVFRAPRAKRCQRCRRNPVRVTLHPLEQGGWHVGFRVGERFDNGEFDRTSTT